jgi:hypothetical protein
LGMVSVESLIPSEHLNIDSVVVANRWFLGLRLWPNQIRSKCRPATTRRCVIAATQPCAARFARICAVDHDFLSVGRRG